jgi:hypothetical protein
MALWAGSRSNGRDPHRGTPTWPSVSLGGMGRGGWAAPRSSALVIVLAVVAVVGASGCSPKRKTQVAVRRAPEGNAQLVLALCPDVQPERVNVFTVSGTPTSEWTVTRPSTAAATDVITVFEAPHGWQVGGSLRTFVPGQTYIPRRTTRRGRPACTCRPTSCPGSSRSRCRCQRSISCPGSGESRTGGRTRPPAPCRAGWTS